MNALLIVLVALVLLLLLAAWVLMDLAVSRIPHFFRKRMSGSAFEPYKEQVQRELEWFRGLNPETVEMISRDALMLRGRYLPSEGSSKTILLMHGYRCRTGEVDFAPLLRFYHEQGFNLLVVDQRAHGASEGKHITFGAKERFDCADWLNWLNCVKQPEQLYMAGVSMGASTVLMATGLNLPENLMGIIADCGYTSPWDICRQVLKTGFHLPPFPLLYLTDGLLRLWAGFELRECSAWEALQTNTMYPVLFIHGEADQLIPVEMTKRNDQACSAPKELLTIPDANHGLSAWVAPEKVQAAILHFLKQCEQDDFSFTK